MGECRIDFQTESSIKTNNKLIFRQRRKKSSHHPSCSAMGTKVGISPLPAVGQAVPREELLRGLQTRVHPKTRPLSASTASSSTPKQELRNGAKQFQSAATKIKLRKRFIVSFFTNVSQVEDVSFFAFLRTPPAGGIPAHPA